MPSEVLAVIPARWGATRLPGKPLATLWGKPLIQHVWERAREIRGLDLLVIATDDDRIEQAARAFGAIVERTSPECASGSDRVAEVVRRRPDVAIVINVQGDEPELDAEAVTRLVAAMRADPSIRMATLVHRETDAAAMASSNTAKVEVDPEGFALTFTRTDISLEPGRGPVFRHVGVYGFRRDSLLEFSAWAPTPNEQAERLEQLRALDHGVRIRVVESLVPSSGVDTPEQLAALERRGPR